jgi:outer membrane lipoprotein-sorting protein
MKKIFLPVTFLFVLIPFVQQIRAAQNVDEIIEKHLAALGGRAALEKLTTRKSTGTVTLSTPAGELTGPAELYLKAPNKSRAYVKLDLTAMGMADPMIIEQRFDGTKGVMMNSMQGDTETSGKQLENLRNNIFPSPLLGYKAAGIRIDMQPKETVNGRSAIVLLLTPKTGSPSRLFLDAETYLPLRSIITVESPETGEFEQVSDLSDYRTVDGIKIPFKIVNTSAVQNLTIKLDKVEHNVAIDDAMFAVKGK